MKWATLVGLLYGGLLLLLIIGVLSALWNLVLYTASLAILIAIGIAVIGPDEDKPP